jgi:predicted O-methyltransferase YrrM
MKTRFFILACILTVQSYSFWDPKEINPNYIENSDFANRKQSVISYLKNSWVSKEKAQLILDLMMIIKPEKCVEIGTFTGSSALPIMASLQYLKHGKIKLIDAWSNKECVKNISFNDHHYKWWNSLNMTKMKAQCLNMIHEWKLESTCEIIHATSEQAINQIDQIDFLHIDGNFSEQGSLLDATLYLPKVKNGGYILLSNAMFFVNNNYSKQNTIWFLMQECEFIADVDNGNSVLFRKL